METNHHAKKKILYIKYRSNLLVYFLLSSRTWITYLNISDVSHIAKNINGLTILMNWYYLEGIKQRKLILVILLQNGYSSPTESSIMNDLILTIYEVCYILLGNCMLLSHLDLGMSSMPLFDESISKFYNFLY